MVESAPALGTEMLTLLNAEIGRFERPELATGEDRREKEQATFPGLAANLRRKLDTSIYFYVYSEPLREDGGGGGHHGPRL